MLVSVFQLSFHLATSAAGKELQADGMECQEVVFEVPWAFVEAPEFAVIQSLGCVSAVFCFPFWVIVTVIF